MSDETYLREPELRGDRDDEGNYINGEDTYRDLAWELQFGERPPIFGWSDQNGTRLDIMMVWGANQLTDLQRGYNAGTHMFVSMMGVGHGGAFDITNGQWKAPSYVAEKLGINPSNPIAKPLSELVNGVAKAVME